MPTPLSTLTHQWAQADRARRAAEVAIGAGALVAAAALFARLVSRWSEPAGWGALLVGGLGAAAFAAWRLRAAWGSPTAAAARADRAGATHDLLQTALAIEAGAATGAPHLQRQVADAAQRAAPTLASGAVRPFVWPKAAMAAMAALLVAHAVLPRPDSGTVSTRASGGAPLFAGGDLAAERDPSAPTSTQPGASPSTRGADALPATAGAQSRGPRDATGRADDAPLAAAAGRGPEANAAKAEAAPGIDPLWAATDLFTPGAGGDAGTQGQLGQGARTGQESAGNAGLNPDGSLAATTDAPEAAAGGDAPEGSDPGAAIDDLMTVKDGDGVAEEGEGGDNPEDQAAPEGEGQGQQADDTEETRDGKGPPPDELTGNDDELGKGEESAGAPGAGGANDAGGSAVVQATARPPEWDVAAEWVEGQWRDAPAQLLEQVEAGRTGRRSTQAWRDVVRNYAAVAEAASTPEQVPPTRRAYVGAYFDALAAPPSTDEPAP